MPKRKTTFKTPNARERKAAISIGSAPAEWVPYLNADTTLTHLQHRQAFDPIPVPSKGSWLHSFPEEEAQTVTNYRNDRPARMPERNKVYILPLGSFAACSSPDLEALQEFASAYLSLTAEVLEPLELEATGDSSETSTSLKVVFPASSSTLKSLEPKEGSEYLLTSRINPHTKNVQLLTTDIEVMLKDLMPLDACCFVALTMEDLYPNRKWNFVFGEANTEDHVGVFSFARYCPGFPSRSAENLSEQDYYLLLWRSCHVMVHEILHMFCIAHCHFFHCCMNGSNSLEESDSQPLQLCPIDLHKLAIFQKDVLALRFDPLERYKALLAFFTKHKRPGNHMEKEHAWVSAIIQELTSSSSSSSSSSASSVSSSSQLLQRKSQT